MIIWFYILLSEFPRIFFSRHILFPIHKWMNIPYYMCLLIWRHDTYSSFYARPKYGLCHRNSSIDRTVSMCVFGMHAWCLTIGQSRMHVFFLFFIFIFLAKWNRQENQAWQFYLDVTKITQFTKKINIQRGFRQ